MKIWKKMMDQKTFKNLNKNLTKIKMKMKIKVEKPLETNRWETLQTSWKNLSNKSLRAKKMRKNWNSTLIKWKENKMKKKSKNKMMNRLTSKKDQMRRKNKIKKTQMTRRK